MSGLMSINGDEDGPPLPVPIPVADIGAGMFAAIGILAALQSRQTTGRGQRVDTSLLETPIAWSVYEAANFFATGDVPRRMGQGHRASAPYQAFRTQDGWLNIGGGSPGFWPKICAVLGLDHLVADARFATPADRVANRKGLAALIEERLAGDSTAHWLARFDAEGIPVGPILAYDEVFADPHVRDRQMIVEVEHTRAGRSRVLGVPVKLSDTPGTIRRAAPTLGQHTREILAELGLDAATITRLAAAAVIQEDETPPG
jgi:crotonobetainyl-CoA:carnitine CoA-transferase CaiB-like acyl-CoA transferase